MRCWVSGWRVASEQKQMMRQKQMGVQKQMGPAFLPTPLSPARGRFSHCSLPGKPFVLLFPQRAWRPMSIPFAPRLRFEPCGFLLRHGRASGFVTGARTGIRPYFVTASLGWGRNLSPRLTSPLARPRPRSYRSTVFRCSSEREAVFLQPLPASTVAFSDDAASHLPQTSRLALCRSLLHVFSQSARGQSPPHLRNSKTSEIQGLAAFISEPSCSEDK